ncbi:MAG: DUF1902 domain-containing protein [Clostridiales bacterium]|nr:DUF1902 domain-containing protein [Clostridiales bacterium]
MKCRIDIFWDAEAAVWIATSNDVKGLVLESGSLDALIERVRVAVPELLELNNYSQKVIDLTIISERHDQVAANG